jgi:hypothetical protein
VLVALLALTADPALAAAPATGNRLSKRIQLRYQDVLVTRDGTRWRGKIIERGEVYRIRLADLSEVAVPKEQVASLTRELDPGLIHTGQWVARVSAGVEAAVAIGDEAAGLRSGPLLELSLSKNISAAFEPEVIAVLSPLGTDEEGGWAWQLGVGARFYLSPTRRLKPFTITEVVVAGVHADLGLRTGPGLLWDLTENIGVGFSQGFTLVSQVDPSTTMLGYHVALDAQARF